MNYVFCQLGQDARQQAAAQALRAAGHTVRGLAGVAAADCLLLPMPLPDLDGAALAALQAAKPGALAMAGLVSETAAAKAKQAGVELIDYYRRDELACLNAVPTAEGCLCLLMQQRPRTIWESPILVLGYGRVGQAVARRLAALGARVTVAARSAEQRAGARCAGCHAAPLSVLDRLLPGFDAVVNTIPAPVLGPAQLARLPKGAVIVDLASAPGGTDFAAAAALGLHAALAPGLPGRCAPDTAGELIAHTVLNILAEREQGRER